MRDRLNYLFAIVGIIVIIILVLFGILTLGFRTGYKKCARDFYEGTLQVELIELPNGERKWEWIDND